MVKRKISRILLSVVIVNTAFVSLVVDWNSSHIFNPEWPPHARFHDVVMLHMLSGCSLIALWLLWRQSAEPDVGFKVAALIPVIFWSAFFYTTLLVPGTGLNANPSEAPPSLAGIPLYPNVIIAAINVMLAAISYWLYRRESALNRNPL